MALAEVEKVVTVACAANAAYAMPLAVMLRSAARNLADGWALHAYVVDDGLGDSNRDLILRSLPENTSARWLGPARMNLDELPLWGRMPVTTYYKMMIAEMLPKDVSHVVWLDCDMLVLNDLVELVSRGSGEHTLAVQDSLVPKVTSRFGVAGSGDMGLDSDSEYFNAGLMVIDAEQWRKDRVAGRALEYLRAYGERVYFWDQEALNAVLAGKWKSLPAEWNWSANNDRLASGSMDSNGRRLPFIIHFNGNIKPWTVLNSERSTKLWLTYLDETPWKGWRPPRTARGLLLSWYATSRLRRVTYPAEQWTMQLTRKVTQRHA